MIDPYGFTDPNWRFPNKYVDMCRPPNLRAFRVGSDLKGHAYSVSYNSGYMLIFVAPEDQEKTTFTYTFRTFAHVRMLFGLYNAQKLFKKMHDGHILRLAQKRN